MYVKNIPGPIVGAEYGNWRVAKITGGRVFFEPVDYGLGFSNPLSNWGMSITRLPPWLAKGKPAYCSATGRTVIITAEQLTDPEFLDLVSQGHYVEPVKDVWVTRYVLSQGCSVIERLASSSYKTEHPMYDSKLLAIRAGVARLLEQLEDD